MKPLGFPRARRLRSPRDFARVYAARLRAADHRLLIFAAPNAVHTTRIGLSVSKKHGNSVVRHRIKRLLREAYRLEQHELPEGLDLVLIPRGGPDVGMEEYRASLRTLVPRLARRLRERSSDVASRRGGTGGTP